MSVSLSFLVRVAVTDGGSSRERGSFERMDDYSNPRKFSVSNVFKAHSNTLQRTRYGQLGRRRKTGRWTLQDWNDGAQVRYSIDSESLLWLMGSGKFF